MMKVNAWLRHFQQSGARLFVIMAATMGLVAGACAAEVCDLSPVLEALRAEHNLPGCAAAVMVKGTVSALGAAGVRRVDRDARVTAEDVWHIGSCTKSMTAALVGMLVDEGQLRWEMSVAETLPGVKCDPSWNKLTLWDLVTHRCGLGAAWPPAEVMTRDPESVNEARTRLARWAMSKPPPMECGKSLYSNVGYALLGAILERASGMSYETLMRSRIFGPLALESAGFGAAATPGEVDQPWGHRRRERRLVPVEPLPENQFPPVLAPAGSVHLSLREFAEYAYWQSVNVPALLKPETFARLHTPPENQKYAGGMWMTEMPGIGGQGVAHSGHMGGSFAIFHAGPDVASVCVFNTEGGGWEWLGEVIAAAVLKAAQK